LFIQNYKNKIIISISYLHSIPMIYNNPNLSEFKRFDYMLINEELSELVYEEKNIFFLENFYFEIYDKIKELISLGKYGMLQDILLKLFIIIKGLPKLKLINKIGNNKIINNIIIDIICLFNNLNKFAKEDKKAWIYFTFITRFLLNSEIYILSISALMSHLLDYSNLEFIKSIFSISK